MFPYSTDMYLHAPLLFILIFAGLLPLCPEQDSWVGWCLDMPPLHLGLISVVDWFLDESNICLQSIGVPHFIPPSQFAFLGFSTPPPTVGYILLPIIQDFRNSFSCMAIYCMYNICGHIAYD